MHDFAPIQEVRFGMVGFEVAPMGGWEWPKAYIMLIKA